MDVYRSRRTFGVLENKLLTHSLLRRLALPVVPVLYGALAAGPMGEWQGYSRDRLIEAPCRRPRAHSLGPNPGTTARNLGTSADAGAAPPPPRPDARVRGQARL